jgi:glycopeptide antibiotics resistance protein
MNGWLRVFLVALALSLAIEAAQLVVPNRMADVDDVLLNVAGALIGYAILSILRLGSRPRQALAE